MSLKSFGLIDNVWFKSEVKFPLIVGKKYIIRNLYKDKFEYSDYLKQWELYRKHSTGSYPYIIEILNEHERTDCQKELLSISQLVSLLRLIKYNRMYFAHIICFENKEVSLSISEDNPRPSSFSGIDEEISKKDIKLLNKIYDNIKQNNPKNNKRVMQAFYFWNLSSCSGTFERKTVEMFISLESLFTNGNEEVTFRLASRMAWFLENKDSTRRVNLYKKIKKAYSIRSNIVHGKTLVESKDLPIVQELHSLTRNILIKIFTNKKLLLTFSQSDTEDYFNELVMGNNQLTST